LWDRWWRGACLVPAEIEITLIRTYDMAKCTVCGANAGFMFSMCNSCIQAGNERREKEGVVEVGSPSPTRINTPSSRLMTLRRAVDRPVVFVPITVLLALIAIGVRTGMEIGPFSAILQRLRRSCRALHGYQRLCSAGLHLRQSCPVRYRAPRD
jgi:hypothetical protein